MVLLLSIFLVSEVKIVFPGVLGANYLMIRGAQMKGLHLIFVSIEKDLKFFALSLEYLSFFKRFSKQSILIL